MDKYFNSYREMISLRGLTDHTIKSYSTYIKAYFDFLTDVIHKSPEDVSWDEMRQFIGWVQNTRSLSDRTINAVISQLRFFTIYVLHNLGMIRNSHSENSINTCLMCLPSRK